MTSAGGRAGRLPTRQRCSKNVRGAVGGLCEVSGPGEAPDGAGAASGMYVYMYARTYVHAYMHTYMYENICMYSKKEKVPYGGHMEYPCSVHMIDR